MEGFLLIAGANLLVVVRNTPVTSGLLFVVAFQSFIKKLVVYRLDALVAIVDVQVSTASIHILRPKFELVLDTLDKELGGLGIGEWTKPHGGYFISFDSLDGCAKAIVAKAKEAGVVLTGAGATYPYGKDPKDSNIRIAPSFPTLEDLGKAAQVFVLCVKLVSVEKLLG